MYNNRLLIDGLNNSETIDSTHMHFLIVCLKNVNKLYKNGNMLHVVSIYNIPNIITYDNIFGLNSNKITVLETYHLNDIRTYSKLGIPYPSANDCVRNNLDKILDIKDLVNPNFFPNLLILSARYGSLNCLKLLLDIKKMNTYKKK